MCVVLIPGSPTNAEYQSCIPVLTTSLPTSSGYHQPPARLPALDTTNHQSAYQLHQFWIPVLLLIGILPASHQQLYQPTYLTSRDFTSILPVVLNTNTLPQLSYWQGFTPHPTSKTLVLRHSARRSNLLAGIQSSHQ